MISDKLYLEAEQSGITVLCGAELSLTKSVSVELPDGEMFIGIDDSVMRSRAEERVGDINVWELSEYFDVTEEFMQKVLKFYFGEK
mgnify:CR=1 FL=1